MKKIKSIEIIEDTTDVVISTWQSVWQLPKAWFQQFDVIIGDEAHTFKAKCLTTIMEKLVDVEYRIGTTGSLDGSKVHSLVLEGMFGKVYDVTSTNKLQEEGSLAKLEITSLILNYPDDVKKNIKGIDYQEEMKFLISNKKRNNFIKNLTIGCKGNTLLLFQFVEKHGAILYDLIKEKTDRQIYFIHGSTPVIEREEIRNLLTTENDSIIIASYGCYSTGVNIPSIENIIFASPSKSRIRNLQSIGRGLRLNKGKTVCKLYDLTDNLSYKSWKNTTLKHGVERYKLYLEEKFPVKIIEVNL